VSAALEIERLTVRFGDVTAVDDLTLAVAAGEVLALLGHNGAGKTTTVRAANGLAEPAAGRVRVLGLSPVDDGPALRRRTAVLTDAPGLDERLTARETLRFAAEVYDLPRVESRARVDALLEELGLAARADDRTGAFSRGMRQRLSLARALLHRPEVLFLDEPTTGLDPAATRQLHGVIRHLTREEGRTVVLCTHNLDEAESLADRVALLARGRLLALGTPAELERRVAGAAGASRAARLTLEVHADDVAAALAAVGDLAPHAVADAPSGGAIAIDGLARDEIPSLVARLAGAGVRVYAVTPARATLADAYFALQPDAAPTVNAG
jgi:ABC-2 type transport system ATP-binding protein